jgi:hypothetical protein
MNTPTGQHHPAETDEEAAYYRSLAEDRDESESWRARDAGLFDSPYPRQRMPDLVTAAQVSWTAVFSRDHCDGSP